MKRASILCMGMLGSALALSAVPASDSWRATAVFHAIMPAGYDVLLIKPGGAVLTFLGLIECPELEGTQQLSGAGKAKIVNADGKTLDFFPSHFSFRVTASLRKSLVVEPRYAFENAGEPQELLLKLRFRLIAHNGLQKRSIDPESVQLIGVPPDVRYDERVYRVAFSVDDLPVTDRCVLEILSSDGKPLSRFHFDLL